jgi:hypothetical protein
MIFKLIKEIKSKDGVLHFRRWRVLSTPWFKICLHAIYKADDDKHLHNHPWNFIGVVLKGAYTERMPGSKLIPRLPGMFAKRTRNQFHKVEDLHSPVVYTLNFMWGFKDEWGYMVNGHFVDHEEYRKRKNNGQI